MAILRGIEGRAHVESNPNLLQWSGYIIVRADFGQIRCFDTVGPAAFGVYAGPIVIDGKYYLADGIVAIRKVDSSSPQLRVEFVGVEKLNIVHLLSAVPNDFLEP